MKKSLLDSFTMLIRFWEHSSEPWGIRDNKSRFVYSNPRNHKLLGLPDNYNLEGRVDSELPSVVSEFEEEWQAHDRQVQLLQERITAVEIHAWDGLSFYQPYFFDKYPIIDESGASQGVIFHGRAVEDVILTQLNKIKVPISLIFTPPSNIFLKREWEVLFYILHVFSNNEIAKKLNVSPRAIYNITQSLYKKLGVCNKRQIIEYCYENKISNYVPKSFFEYSGSFPLM
ncbi:helix-turn-helix transcriptional regulator [Yersinia mollaretii]|uniref:helix-turn-helix transcriptional regulator n=1 Tax=Yersinia mollaretii TaxID=33060 RepID=UPI0011A8FBA9|nr:PAS and helix-turn-helix domain-containing protein [Yersinia mollaretii]